MESKPTDNDNDNENDSEDEDEDEDEDEEENGEMSLEERYKNILILNKFLRKEVQSKNVMIQTLVGEIEKRDRILQLSSTPSDDVEVLLNFTPDGHPIYEIRNKQKIPYWIKTETLDPVPQVDFTDDLATKLDEDEEELDKITQLQLTLKDKIEQVKLIIKEEKTNTEFSKDKPSTSTTGAFSPKNENQPEEFEIKDVEDISNDPESFEIENSEHSENSQNSRNSGASKNSEKSKNLQSPEKSENIESRSPEISDKEIEDGEIDSDSPDEDKTEKKVSPTTLSQSQSQSKNYANLFELGKVSPISSLSSVSLSSNKTSKISPIKLPPAPPPPKISLKFDSAPSSKSSRSSRSSKRSRRLEHQQEEEDEDEEERIPEKRSRTSRTSENTVISPSKSKKTTHISIQIRVSEDSEQRIITETETARERESPSPGKSFPRISVKESESESECSSLANPSSSSSSSTPVNPKPYIPDLESLDYGFWADARNSDVPKFLVRFHHSEAKAKTKSKDKDKDKDQEKEKNEREKIYTLIQQLEHRPPEILEIGLRDIFKRLKKFESPNPNPKSKETSKAGQKARIWLDVRNPWIFSNPKSSNFNFSLIGASVTHFHLGPRLRLELRTPEEQIENGVKSSIFLEFLLRHFPNLEFLAINTDLLYGLDSVRELRGESLKKLRTVHFIQPTDYKTSRPTLEPCGQFLRKIFKKAPNLQYIYGIPVQYVDKIDDDSKVRSFSSLSYERFEQTAHDFQHQLSVLSKSRKFDRLEEADTRTWFVKNMPLRNLCISNWSRILSRNAYTIKTLHLEADGPKKVNQVLTFPTLRRVEKIVFHMNPNLKWNLCYSTVPSFFSKEMEIRDFVTKFPALINVEISMETEEDEEEEEERELYIDAGAGEISTASTSTSALLGRPMTLFENNFPPRIFTKDTFLNVRGLTLRNFCPVECFPKIPTIFSNIRVLRLCHRAKDVAAVLPHVFKYWKGLQWLILEVDTSGNLDAGISGIDKDVCDNLKDNLQQLEDPQIQQRISRQRINLPISHLNDLTFLRIVLRRGDTFDISRPIMTQISALHGFGKDLMPKLTVQLGFHESVTLNDKELMISSLSSILPFVILES